MSKLASSRRQASASPTTSSTSTPASRRASAPGRSGRARSSPVASAPLQPREPRSRRSGGDVEPALARSRLDRAQRGRRLPQAASRPSQGPLPRTTLACRELLAADSSSPAARRAAASPGPRPRGRPGARSARPPSPRPRRSRGGRPASPGRCAPNMAPKSDSDDQPVEDDAEECPATLEEEPEQQGEEQADHRALAGAQQRGPPGGQPPGDLLDRLQAGADDRRALDRKVLVGEEVDGALGLAVAAVGGDGGPRRRRRCRRGLHRRAV